MHTGDPSSSVRRRTTPCAWVAHALYTVAFLLLSTYMLQAMPRSAFGDSAGQLLLTEVMIDPRATSDQYGEWIEIANLSDAPIELHHWSLEIEAQPHEFTQPYILAPGRYVVIARNMDPAANGGVAADLALARIRLPNEHGAIRLLSPSGQIADALSWGVDVGLLAPEGASLERQGTDRQDPWQPATHRWSGSAGDRGSPGLPYTPPTPTPEPTHTDAPTATPVPPTPTETATAPPAPPHIRLSELMANPAAVPDEAGEWIELFNAGDSAVNLRDWRLADLDTDAHLVNSELWIQPGEYLVLGRNADPASNGGVPVRYLYDGLALANESDELLLFAPWGEEVDRLHWGEGTALSIPKGASLERIGFDPGNGWVVAWQPWPGSLGDFGSPGAAYAPGPATPTPTSASTPIASPTAIATFAPAWPTARAQSSLAIDEVYADGSEHEFVAIANLGSDPVSLAGWSLGDAETPGDNEGLYALPGDATLKPGALFVLARNASAFSGRWGFAPDAEWEDSDPTVPTLARVPDSAAGTLALNDAGDEVLLLNPALELADAVAWGNGSYASLRLDGNLQLRDGYSLQRVPGFRYQPHFDVRHRFLASPPQPAAMRTVPPASPAGHPVLADGKMAVWGSLGTRSNFSVGGQAPPHWLAAVAAAGGLDYIAVADDNVAHSQDRVRVISSIIAIPAWRWHNSDGAGAIVYTDAPESLQSWGDLRGYLDERECTAQAAVLEPPAIQRLSAIGSDDLSSERPSALVPGWQSAGRPLIPAGNALPISGGLGENAPRHTGLAVERLDDLSIWEAMAARRGWLTSSAGLWLTLRTRQGDWMGQTVTATGDLTLEVQYGDRSGETAGLSLWQNDRLLRRLDVAGSGETWTVELPALPGSFYFAVATQLDGDFAVTAPILVAPQADIEVDVDEIPDESPPRHRSAGQEDGDESTAAKIATRVETGEAAGPPGSLANAKLQGLGANVEFRAQVVAPPGLFNSAIYVAEPAADAANVAGLGIQVYLQNGDYQALGEGDWVQVRGRLHSFRGELETIVEQPDQVWRFDTGSPVQPLPVRAFEVGESLEGRLVTFTGDVTRWQGDSIYLCDPAQPDAEVRVTVRSSLGWRRPYVNVGESWQVTGIVSQFAKESPWNGGYRLLVRYPADLLQLETP